MAEQKYKVKHPINFGRKSEEGRWERGKVVTLDEEAAAEYRHALEALPELEDPNTDAEVRATSVASIPPATPPAAPPNSTAAGTTGTPEQALRQPGTSIRPGVSSDAEIARLSGQEQERNPAPPPDFAAPAETQTSANAGQTPPQTSEGSGDESGDGSGDAANAEPQDQKVDATAGAVKRAEELGVDLSKVRGTGQNGRIQQPDVEKFHEENQG